MKKGTDITSENYYELIKALKEEEARSLGLVNHVHARQFIQDWFENERK